MAYYGKNEETSNVINFLQFKKKKNAKEINGMTADSISGFTNKQCKVGFKTIMHL